MPRAQIDLFGSQAALPGGFRYGTEIIDERAESSLLARISELPFYSVTFRTVRPA
jgi:hypothetical protein